MRLDKRVKILLGRNPFERMRDTLGNPGHYREYTAAEVEQTGRNAGLVPISVARHNYFGSGGGHPALHAVYARAERFVPATLREGITAEFGPA